jgi:hypothetical protein
MLFTKEIEKITYQDVSEFCEQQYRESVHLDYKQDIDASLAKTIAAMANTWGGLIVIGVEDEDSKPKLPAVGISCKEHLREQVNNIILGNVTPPVFPEIQVCQSEDNRNAFIVIRVPQSNLSPHAVRGNTKVYVRTDTSNEPEELATVDRLLWLVEKRKKSTDLKYSFYGRADERFGVLCKKANTYIGHTDVVFAMCPTYPFEILVDYRSLQHEIPNRIAVQAWGYSFPLFSMARGEFSPTQNGTYGFFVNEHSGYILYEELNHYGFFYHREDLCHTDKTTEGELKHHSLLWDILTRTDIFLETMSKFYSELGYWGLLELKISLNKLDDVNFRDLPAPRGYMKFDDITVSTIDHKLEFAKAITYRELAENRVELVVDIVKEVSWAIGFSHIESETIRKLMAEKGRI